MQQFSYIAEIFVVGGIVSALIIATDLRACRQQMRIMNSVWILTGLWASVFGLWAYYAFGRERRCRQEDAAARATAKAEKKAGKSGMEMTDADSRAKTRDMKIHGTDATTKHTEETTGKNMDKPHTVQMDGMEGMPMDGAHSMRMDGMEGMRMDKPHSMRMDGAHSMRMDGMEEMRMDGAHTMRMDGMEGMRMDKPHSMRMDGMEGMRMDGAHSMRMDGMEGMRMGPRRPRWQSVVLSTLHCGAGCTLADLIGEWFLYFVPVAIGGSLIAGSWVLDYILALVFGIGFQYAAIRGMEPRTPRGEIVRRAAKADILSLTAWQVGMYGWMAVVIFALNAGTLPPRTTFGFWFMMQIAMACGFLIALPVNVLLIKFGIKKGM